MNKSRYVYTQRIDSWGHIDVEFGCSLIFFCRLVDCTIWALKPSGSRGLDRIREITTKISDFTN